MLIDHEQKRPWLSEKTGIPISTINTWFKTNRVPRVDHAYAIARALNTTVEYLLTGEDPPIEDISSPPEFRDLHRILRGLNRDQVLELRGVVQSYLDMHFRVAENKAAGT